MDETQQFNQSSGVRFIYDYAYQSLAGRFNHFGGKYLAEFVFRYDASSRFPSGDLLGILPRYPSDGVFRRKTSERVFAHFIENLKSVRRTVRRVTTMI